MFESPNSLQDVCLDYITDNMEALCEVATSPETGTTTMCLKNDDFFIHSNFSDYLLRYLCQKGKLTDNMMAIFNSNVTALKRVRLKDVNLSTKGLRMLKFHKVIDLEAIGLKGVTVNDLIGCLGEWTLTNLRSLNVANSTFMNSAKFCVVVSLSKLKNLHSLNVSNTEFNRHGLEIIAEDLPILENLDISNTPVTDLSPLLKCKERLKSLCMYNLRASHTDDIIPVLCELHKLLHLDVSDDFSVQPFVNLQPVKFRVDELLKRRRCLPCLTSLDISGKDKITVDLLSQFLYTHPNIRFLGLALTDACELPMFSDRDSHEFREDIVVTGEAIESQIIEALKRYINRSVYVQKSLYHLFSITHGYPEARTDMIKFILPAMENHPRELGVQMAATACLYNLSKGELGQKIHPKWLGNIVRLTMEAMQNFPNHQQLQKNALLTLCSDRILQDVSFDRYRCAKLVMECLCSFEDPSMNRMSVAIVSILAAKIPTAQTSQLGAKAAYMKKLLAIVREKKDAKIADTTMKFTLSALWNLTDESPSTCDVFLAEGGLELFMDVIEAYETLGDADRTQVETKVLGLINNLAEVRQLRKSLMRDDVASIVRKLLNSSHIDVSYFAAGIISHLVTDDKETLAWTVNDFSKQELLDDLGKVVLQWEQPQGEMVAYRSFSPFFPLLAHFNAPEVQLWAVWAIQHVCTKNGARYCPMLVEEHGSDMLYDLVTNPSTHCEVVRLSNNVLDIIARELGRSPMDVS